MIALGVAVIGAARGIWSLALAGVATALIVPLASRVIARKWFPGLWLRGLAVGFIASHLPVFIALYRAVQHEHCAAQLCMHAVRLGAMAAPVAALIGTVAYWAVAEEPPKPRVGVSARDLRP